MARVRGIVLAGFLALTGAPALAHPHVFIETRLELRFDADGALEQVAVAWEYDDFYSLLMTEEYGLDPDGDGTPDPQALQDFAGGDVDWAAGFPGDLVIALDGVALPLAPPVSHTATYVDGRITTAHIRPLQTPVKPQGAALSARAYDPYFYVAYDVIDMPVIIGRSGCTITRDAADIAQARAQYGAILDALDTTADALEAVDLPDVGILFSDRFTIRCSASE